MIEFKVQISSFYGSTCGDLSKRLISNLSKETNPNFINDMEIDSYYKVDHENILAIVNIKTDNDEHDFNELRSMIKDFLDEIWEFQKEDESLRIELRGFVKVKNWGNG